MCLSARMHMCMYVCVHVWCMHVCIHVWCMRSHDDVRWLGRFPLLMFSNSNAASGVIRQQIENAKNSRDRKGRSKLSCSPLSLAYSA